jgi:hypothetical protein
MLGLTLRKEFQGKRLKGTAIELTNEKKTGATQVPARDFLGITYPTGDVLKSIETISPGQGRPLVLIGERGQGKSHLMGVLYHALTDAQATKDWLLHWADRLQNDKVASLSLREGMLVISESLHRQQYKFLWDLLFERHPHGSFIRGKWEGLGAKATNVPPADLILELLKKQPTALILDEFQTWFDGLTNTKNHPWRNWAFNVIQVLSEIAKEHPELLVLVVSVRNGQTDAYQQIHRVNPVRVDFKGSDPDRTQRDRRRLLLHRLFENRLNISHADIEHLVSAHVGEYLRLAAVPPAEHDRRRQDFLEMWPFAPHLMQLLEDQVLAATEAQETRDLIRILADLFKTRGAAAPVLTAADFRLDDESSGIAALLSSVANQHHAALREKAQRNLSAVMGAVPSAQTTVPHLSEIVGALWLRSLAAGNVAGADAHTLQIDITREKPIDDNAFHVELSNIVENSFNIHQEADRLVFRAEENPQAKLMAFARNDRLFTDGSDHTHLACEIRYVIGGSDDVARAFRVIVLREAWLTDPWSAPDESDGPDRWDDRLPIVVLPEDLDRLDARLGAWLKDHVPRRRNTIRFLLPCPGSTNAYQDRDLLVLARAVLKAEEWAKQSPEYGSLHGRYQKGLRGIVKTRFDRFAVLRTWNFIDPSRCRFQLEVLKAQGDKIPEAIEERVREVFVPEDFEALVLAAAENSDSVGKLLSELQEPRPNEEDCIAWLGEILTKEKIIRLCASGRIAIDLRGNEYLQVAPGEEQETAWRRMRGKLGTGTHLDKTYVLLPQAVPHTAGVGKQTYGEGEGAHLPPGGLFAPTVAGGTAAPVPHPPGAGPQPGAAEIFNPPTATRTVPLSSPATSALNLMGRVESWGIGPATNVRTVTVRVESATGAQLQKLLKNLPDGMTYELSLEKEEE